MFRNLVLLVLGASLILFVGSGCGDSSTAHPKLQEGAGDPNLKRMDTPNVNSKGKSSGGIQNKSE
jgi:hypothetical protein